MNLRNVQGPPPTKHVLVNIVTPARAGENGGGDDPSRQRLRGPGLEKGRLMLRRGPGPTGRGPEGSRASPLGLARSSGAAFRQRTVEE